MKSPPRSRSDSVDSSRIADRVIPDAADAGSAAVEALQRRIQDQFASLLGMTFKGASTERVVAEMVVEGRHCRSDDVMHGGAIMAFADTLGGAVSIMNLPADIQWTTVESKTNFTGAAHRGTRIGGECVPVHRGRRTLVLQTRVTAEDGRLLALVTQTHLVFGARASENEPMRHDTAASATSRPDRTEAGGTAS